MVVTVGSLMLYEPALAATFRVNSTVDQPGVCTFEAAIAALHEVTPSGFARCSNVSSNPLGRNDQIAFSRIGAVRDISDAFTITRSVQINPGGNRVRFEGTQSSRLFLIRGDNLTGDDQVVVSVDNVELSNGFSNDPGGAINILDGASLTLTNSTVVDNSSWLSGGGIFAFQSSLTVLDSVIENNRSGDLDSRAIDGDARLEGGGISVERSEFTMRGSTIEGNVTRHGSGAGVAVIESTGEVTQSRFINNTANREAGILAGLNEPGNGGGISVITSGFAISDTTFSGNQAVETGGAIYVTSSAPGVPMTSLTNNQIIDNFAMRGAGIVAQDFAFIEVRDSFISSNDASMHGAGVFLSGRAQASIFSSTISENFSALGAGLAVVDLSLVQIFNSTFSGNIGQRGVAIMADASMDAQIFIFQSTLTNNVSSGQGSGIFDSNGNTRITIGNSIIAGNSRLINSFNSFEGSEISASNVRVFGGGNLFGDSRVSNAEAFVGFSPSRFDITATSDGSQPTAIADILNPLSDNGGPTPTHSLTDQSIARENANTITCTPRLTVDQTGKNRLIGPRCDIGAFEAELIDIDTPADTTNSSFYVIPLPNGKSVVVEL